MSGQMDSSRSKIYASGDAYDATGRRRSEIAFGAVIQIKSEYSDGSCEVAFAIAKAAVNSTLRASRSAHRIPLSRDGVGGVGTASGRCPVFDRLVHPFSNGSTVPVNLKHF